MGARGSIRGHLLFVCVVCTLKDPVSPGLPQKYQQLKAELMQGSIRIRGDMGSPGGLLILLSIHSLTKCGISQCNPLPNNCVNEQTDSRLMSINECRLPNWSSPGSKIQSSPSEQRCVLKPFQDTHSHMHAHAHTGSMMRVSASI